MNSCGSTNSLAGAALPRALYVRIDVCIDMSVDLCVDLCVGRAWKGHRRVYGLVCRPVYMHEIRHVQSVSQFGSIQVIEA